MEKQSVKKYFNNSLTSNRIPRKKIEPCPKCGKLPSYFASAGGFHYYGYYKCEKDNIFATGPHQFPNIGISWGENENNEPKLFWDNNEDSNPEDGWNDLVNQINKTK